MTVKAAFKDLLQGRRIRNHGWAHDAYIYLNKSGFIVTEDGSDYNGPFTDINVWEVFK